MKPLFTIHAGEYLTGEYVEKKYPNWNVWIPSKDTGIDFLITNKENKKSVSIQVKFSKDWNKLNDNYTSSGWWSFNSSKIDNSTADFWVLVIPSFLEKKESFVIIKPTELFKRYTAIHGEKKTIQSYLRISKNNKCWEIRGLSSKDKKALDEDKYSNKYRNFSRYLDNWAPIEKILN